MTLVIMDYSHLVRRGTIMMLQEKLRQIVAEALTCAQREAIVLASEVDVRATQVDPANRKNNFDVEIVVVGEEYLFQRATLDERAVCIISQVRGILGTSYKCSLTLVLGQKTEF